MHAGQEEGDIKSIDDLVTCYELNEEFLGAELSCQEHMLDISIRLVDWKKFGRAASLTTAEIEGIQQDGSNEDDRRYKAIEIWHRMKASDATYGALIEILLKIKMVDIAEHVCGLQKCERRESEFSGIKSYYCYIHWTKKMYFTG